MKFGLVSRFLPIKKYSNERMKTVLNVNHVVQILLTYLEHKDWTKVFDKVLTKRYFQAKKKFKKKTPKKVKLLFLCDGD